MSYRKSISSIMLSFCILICSVILTFSQTPTNLSNNTQTMLENISSSSLKGHVSFLSSDLLLGRNTPSQGLDLAAEYIASQFRRAGLQPLGNNAYFQSVDWLWAEPLRGDDLVISYKDQKVADNNYLVSIFSYFDKDINIDNAEVLLLTDEDIQKGNLPAQLENKVLLVHSSKGLPFNLVVKISESKALLCIRSIKRNPEEKPQNQQSKFSRLVHKEEKQKASLITPTIFVDELKMLEIFDKLKNQPIPTTVSIKIPAPREKTFKLKNVVGLLPGSDPLLKDTYILVTAHYDHLGIDTSITDPEADNIFNGANDNASGTASMIEIAEALSKSKEQPKRSILFIAFFGEEKGLYGSEYYAKNPIVPLEKTIAQVNLEQLGRTDTSDDNRPSSLSMTGFDYSNINKFFKMAGEKTNIKFYKDQKYSDPFFFLSDNRPLAMVGIPAHTLCVTFDFPDHHKLNDSLEKIDFENMAKINKTITLGLILLANDSSVPQWNESNPETAPYVQAWKKLHKVN